MGALSALKRNVVKGLEGLLKKSSGMAFPDKEETIKYLSPYLISNGNESHVTLPEVRNIADESLVIFPETLIHASRDYTWKFEAEGHQVRNMRIGSIVSDSKVLQTDFGYVNLLTGDFGPKEVISRFCVS